MSDVFTWSGVHKVLLASAVAIGAVGAVAGTARAAYIQTNLVSNIPGLAAITDPQLVNPWGVSDRAGSPFWISDQGTSNSTLYALAGPTTVAKFNINPPSGLVAIPKTTTGPQGPTGQVSNLNAASF